MKIKWSWKFHSLQYSRMQCEQIVANNDVKTSWFMNWLDLHMSPSSPETLAWVSTAQVIEHATCVCAVVQRSTWTLYPPGQGSTRIRRRILRRQIFFPRKFSGELTQIMCTFVECLGTDCFHFSRIPVEISVVGALNTKRRPTCAGGLLEADSHVGL
jgi:hypothetical protein